MHPNDQIPFYVSHSGTIRIAGSTDAFKAAKCALHCLARSLRIEFFYIGANAGQQAMKAMGIFRYVLEKNTPNHTVYFRPNRVRTEVFENDTKIIKDAVYWDVLVADSSKLEELNISLAVPIPETEAEIV